MDVRLTIGEFSKMTYLSVKALRHYHDVGLLEPVAVDDSSGYRFYSPSQVATAQSIRRFRDLDLPLEEIRAVLEAPDVDARNQVLVEHLDRMQRQLQRTELTVASLQAMLASASPTSPVELRVLDAISALSIEASIAFDDATDFCAAVFPAVHDLLVDAGVPPTGPDTALYSDAFFEEGQGSVVALVPIDGSIDGSIDEVSGAARVRHVEAADVAVMVHEAPFSELDRTYGALGTEVAARGIGRTGPIRERYLSDELAEVCWPITPGTRDANRAGRTHRSRRRARS